MPQRRKPGSKKPARMTVQPPGRLKARGLRSRARLKQAARHVLNARGYPGLRVQDVTSRAGVAAGLFYRYFHNLDELVVELARDFFTEILALNKPAKDDLDPHQWLRQILGEAVRTFAANPGIVACLFGLAGNHQEFDAIWKKNAHNWNLRIAKFLRREAGQTPSEARRMAYMLGAMTEGVIYQTLIRHTEDLGVVGRNPAEIADALADLLYRAVFLRNPHTSTSSCAAGRRAVKNPSCRTQKKRQKK